MLHTYREVNPMLFPMGRKDIHALTVQECKMDLMSDVCTVYNGTL
jgi:hypothetical protein